MLKRVFGLASAALALVILVGGSTVGAGEKAKGAKNTHEGTFVSVKGHKLIMEGKNGKEHSHEVAKNAKVTCDGKACELTDLKAGVTIRVTLNDEKMATRIEARTKKGGAGTLDKK